MTVSSALNRKEFAGDGVTQAFATSPLGGLSNFTLFIREIMV